MLKIGIVGMGGIARCAHIPALKNIKDVEIVAVCDINKKKLEDAENVIGRKVNTYTDYKEMINKEKLDIVDICTPNYLHADIAIYALNNGMHAFSEKPDSVSVENVIAMKEAAIKSGKHLMVMRNNRHLTSSRELKEMIMQGKMGDIYTGRCGWIRKRGIPGKGGWFTNKAQSGGGPLIDLGVHMIDLAIYLMGNPKAVAVSGCTYTKFADVEEQSDSVHASFGESKADGIFDVEDLAIGFIKFDNGASLQIEFSWASNIPYEKNFVELRGSLMGAIWENGAYTLYDGKPNNKIKDTIKRLLMLKKAGNGHHNNLQHFIDVVSCGVEPDYIIDQGINMIKILSAMYESAKTGREVILD